MESKNVSSDQNHIKIGAGTRVRNVIRYSNILLKERNVKEIHFSAIGGAIGSLVNVLEVLRTVYKGLYQTNRISTVSYQTVDSNGKVIQERLYPKFESTLSTEEPVEKGEGYQPALTEEERNKLLSELNNRGRRDGNRGGRYFRGRRGFRFNRGRGFRGNRGGVFSGRRFSRDDRPRGRGFRFNRGRGFRGGFSRGRR